MLDKLREGRERLEQAEKERSHSYKFFRHVFSKDGLNCFSFFFSCSHRRANTGEPRRPRLKSHAQQKKYEKQLVFFFLLSILMKEDVGRLPRVPCERTVTSFGLTLMWILVGLMCLLCRARLWLLARLKCALKSWVFSGREDESEFVGQRGACLSFINRQCPQSRVYPLLNVSAHVEREEQPSMAAGSWQGWQS